MAHEVYNREERIARASERSFGLVMAAVFLIVALAPLLREPMLSEPVRIWALLVAFMFAGLAVIYAAPLRPLNALWTKFGLLLHAIVSPVILALIFFLSVLPIGLLMRVLGKDPLRLRRDPDARSYWIERTPPGPEAATMKNQF